MKLRGMKGLSNGKIHCLSPVKLDIGPGRIEMRIVRDDLSFLTHDRKENPLSSASLVCRNDMFEPEDALHRIEEPVKTPAAGIGFIPSHQAGPLLCAHGRRPTIGQEVNENLFRTDQEEIESGFLQNLLSLLPGGHLDRFDHLDS